MLISYYALRAKSPDLIVNYYYSETILLRPGYDHEAKEQILKIAKDAAQKQSMQYCYFRTVIIALISYEFRARTGRLMNEEEQEEAARVVLAKVPSDI